MPPGMQMTALTLIRLAFDPEPEALGPWDLDIKTRLAVVNNCNIPCPLRDTLR